MIIVPRSIGGPFMASQKRSSNCIILGVDSPVFPTNPVDPFTCIVRNSGNHPLKTKTTMAVYVPTIVVTGTH